MTDGASPASETAHFDIGAALGGGARLIVRRPVSTFGVTLLAALPIYAAALIVASAAPGGSGAVFAQAPQTGLGVLALAVRWAALAAATAGASVLAVGLLRGGAAAPRGAIVASFAALPRVIAVQAMAGGLIVAGLFAAVVPGLALAAALAVATPVAVVEGRWGSALRRSAALTRGNRLRVFVLGLLLAGLVSIVSFVLRGLGTAFAAVSGVASWPLILLAAEFVATTAFAAATWAAAYVQLRRLREGLDPDQLARIFA